MATIQDIQKAYDAARLLIAAADLVVARDRVARSRRPDARRREWRADQVVLLMDAQRRAGETCDRVGFLDAVEDLLGGGPSALRRLYRGIRPIVDVATFPVGTLDTAPPWDMTEAEWARATWLARPDDEQDRLWSGIVPALELAAAGGLREDLAREREKIIRSA